MLGELFCPVPCAPAGGTSLKNGLQGETINQENVVISFASQQDFVQHSPLGDHQVDWAPLPPSTLQQHQTTIN